MTNNEIKHMLQMDEGVQLHAYYDPMHVLTVGVGRNLEVSPGLNILHRKIKLGDSITQAEAEALLEEDIDRVLSALRKQIANFNSLPERYQKVLINMSFQLGTNGIMKWHDMLYAMSQGKDDDIIKAIKDSHYYHQCTNRANRMIQLIQGTNPY